MSQLRHAFTASAAALGVAAILAGCARIPESPGAGPLATACDPDRDTPRAPAEVRAQENPLAITAETIAAGREIYRETARPVPCGQCHGVDGGGRGPLARHLEPEPSNFTCDFYADVPDGQLFWITREGSNFMGVEEGHADVRRPGRRERVTAMRPHRYYLTDTETWQVVAYLRTFHDEE